MMRAARPYLYAGIIANMFIAAFNFIVIQADPNERFELMHHGLHRDAFGGVVSNTCDGTTQTYVIKWADGSHIETDTFYDSRFCGAQGPRLWSHDTTQTTRIS